MSEPHQPGDVAVHNERALKKLAWAIEASVGKFKLILARCNYSQLRLRLVERLQELTSVKIRIFELRESEKTLYAKIQGELGEEQPAALMVSNLESVSDLDQLLITTNQVREEFRKNFHFPLVFWVSDEVLKKLIQLAPDFESWAITTEFALATDELIDFLEQISDQFFEGNLNLSLEACWEIKLACNDLQNREQVLGLKLRASIESLLGLIEQINSANRNLDVALEHYQKGLELWKRSNDLDRQGKLLSNITFCYYLKAFRHREIAHPNWQATKYYLQQCLEVFERVQCPDFIANLAWFFGGILRRLQDWEQLKTLAQKALQLHQTKNHLIEMAQDYGFLAEVALADKRWTDANELIQKAVEVLSTVPSLQATSVSGVAYELLDKSVISCTPSLCRFILAQSQQHLNQPQEAISNLEVARTVGNPEYDPLMYLDILSHLHNLYFEQRQYLKAFEIKLEQQSIEQQYGFRAFVGARGIQPQRQAKLVLTEVECQETVALEIRASGRQLDVEYLMERIGRNDYKIIVIYGQSGVGKSSLVNGGLVPALKQKVIGTQDILPVSMRVYTSWIGELGRLLAEALLNKGIQLTTSLESVVAILEQLQQSESRNLRTVLIFDQFEEFFFVCTDSAQRRQFFEFLADCLNILPVKIIISLREDYIHYLLECNRLLGMAIISNDILSKNVLYHLGNFLPADAKSAIERLTEGSNFHLEPALIEKLVQDLAGELGEVRPIELQMVGAQLQTDNITTIEKYYQLGPNPKEKLVQQSLEEIIKNCGPENEHTARLILYLLTNENGTRPLKTCDELVADLKILGVEADANRLNLILKVLDGSRLVFLVPEFPTNRYQLAHDYLVAFIRQQQAPGLLVELADAKEKQELTEAQLRQALREKEQALRQEQQERRRAEIAEIEALISLSQALLLSHDQLGALIASIKAGKQLQETEVPSPIKLRALDKIWQTVYEIQECNRLQRHTSCVTSVKFSPGSQMIASTSKDKTVKLWSTDGHLLKTLQGHSSVVNSLCFSPDGKMIASASADTTVKLWNTNGTWLKTLEGHNDAVWEVSFSPNGKMIASASADTTVKLWSYKNSNLLNTLLGHDGEVLSVCFSPDGKMIASASADKTVKLWSSRDGTLLKTLYGHSSSVNSVSFSPDGMIIASASADSTIKLRSKNGTWLKILEGHSSSVNGVCFSPDGKTIVSASADKTVKLWRTDSHLLRTFKGHSSSVKGVCFSSDGKTIASASKDKTVKLWRIDSPKLKTFDDLSKHLNELLVCGCDWLQDYLKSNPSVSESDRHLCSGIDN